MIQRGGRNSQRGFLLNPFRFGGGGGLAYATFDPVNTGANCTLSGGDLTATFTGAGSTRTTISRSTGKPYFEVVITAGATSNNVIGIVNASEPSSNFVGETNNSIGYHPNSNVYKNGASIGTGATYAVGDIIGVAIDTSANTLLFYKNGTLSVSVSGLGSGVAIYGAVGVGGGASTTFTANFGATTLSSIPSGYLSGFYP